MDSEFSTFEPSSVALLRFSTRVLLPKRNAWHSGSSANSWLLSNVEFHEHYRCEPCYLIDAGTLRSAQSVRQWQRQEQEGQRQEEEEQWQEQERFIHYEYRHGLSMQPLSIHT